MGYVAISVADKLGRKPVILLASLVFTAGSVMMGLANGKEVLLVGRIVVGVGIGKLIFLI
jgi:SP family myo-inositol transporter-like MFS transporter 13